MKKPVIVHGIYIVIIIASLAFAFWQKTIATEQSKLAFRNREYAVVQAEEAKRQQKMAELNAMEALRQQKIAEEIQEKLKDCENKK